MLTPLFFPNKPKGKCFQLSAALIFSSLISPSAFAWQAEKIASGLTLPWGISYVDEQTLLVTEREGTIKRLDLTSGKQTALAQIDVVAKGQGGLLDIARSPFASDTYYFTYSKNQQGQSATTLAMAQYKDGKFSQWQDLLITDSRSNTSRHFGSRITFDHNSLYFSIGDRGERENGQNTQTHAGSILRLNPDGSVPNTNPFIDNKAVRNEIYSYGHRNPQGIWYDNQTKQLWSIEHGPRGGDEINLIKAGANYGWPVTSHGKEYWGPVDVGEAKEKPGITSPIKVYVPSIAPGSLVLYRGEKFPELNGKLIAGALKLMHLNVITLNKQNQAIDEQRLLENLNERIRDIETTPAGDILFATDNGNIYRLIR